LRDAALGCGPVDDIEPGHARELALVGGDESCAMAERLRGDQQVVMADRRAGALELRADRAGFPYAEEIIPSPRYVAGERSRRVRPCLITILILR
jgi:hypothetical protein